MDSILVAPASDQEMAVFALAREVAGLLRGLPRTLIGGLMVRIIEAEHGVRTGFATGDVDALLDVRAFSTATEEAATRLMAAGFEPERHDQNLTYRFIRRSDIVDVLAPDNLGERANIRTVPPDETLAAIGGRQALNRSRAVAIDDRRGPFEIRMPSLAGAIIIKARVVANAQRPDTRAKHERDLARLLSLVTDPVGERAGLSGKERGYLRARADLLDVGNPAWRGIRNPADGALALSLLSDAG